MKRYWYPLTVLILSAGLAFPQESTASHPPIPVLAWAAIPAPEIRAERFRELREMGITIGLSSCPDLARAEQVLDLAREAGLQMVISCPELKTDPERTVKKVMGHAALAGYFLKDEPVRAEFAELGAWVRRIAAVDSRHFCLVNLMAGIHPTRTEALGAASYAEFVRTFIGEVPVQLLSFDFYPVLQAEVHERWYESLEIFSAEARKAAKPFWAFALASSYNELHPVPTVAALRLQMFSNLAYGAQGLQYWTYWMSQGLRSAPISLSGRRTVVYDRIRQVNGEIQAMGGFLSGARVVRVGHTGTVIPRGTSRLEKLPWAVDVLETDGAGALVSVLEKGESSFLAVINRDLQRSLALILLGDESLQKIQKDGSVGKASAYENRTDLEPGDMALYRFPTKSTRP